MTVARRVLAVLLGCAAVTGAAGCGSDDVVDRARDQAEQVRKDVERRVTRAERQFDERRERYGKRIRDVLRDLDKVFQRPARTSPTVRSRGNNQPQTVDVFMTELLQDIDRYWERTFQAADLPAPRVSYDWIAPGGFSLTSCGEPARDSSAFYCPADDTIYVGQQFAADLYEGVAQGLPGQSAGVGRAAGDFAVAYVLAHEYAHNLQHELGVFDNRVGSSAKPFELQADCLAGTWAYSVYAEGALEPGDLEEATNAALAVGDFDVGNAQHHGKPEERRAALLTGFESGQPSSCEQYLT